MPYYTTGTANYTTDYRWYMPYTTTAGTTAGYQYVSNGAYSYAWNTNKPTQQNRDIEDDFNVDEDAWREFMEQ